jgi:hypothetical protein
MELAIQRIRDVHKALEQVLDAVIPADSLFEIDPRDDEARSIPIVRPISHWVMDKLLQKAETKSAGARHRLFRNISLNPCLAPPAGSMWEAAVHKFFREVGVSVKLMMRSLEDGDLRLLSLDKLDVHACEDDAAFKSLVFSHYRDRSSCYLYPAKPNLSGMISILLVPDQPTISFQITTASSHPVAISGLQTAQRWFNSPEGFCSDEERERFKELRPTKTRPWYIVFIVPKRIGELYVKPQKLDPDKIRDAVSGDFLHAADPGEDCWEAEDEPDQSRELADGNEDPASKVKKTSSLVNAWMNKTHQWVVELDWATVFWPTTKNESLRSSHARGDREIF